MSSLCILYHAKDNAEQALPIASENVRKSGGINWKDITPIYLYTISNNQRCQGRCLVDFPIWRSKRICFSLFTLRSLRGHHCQPTILATLWYLRGKFLKGLQLFPLVQNICRPRRKQHYFKQLERVACSQHEGTAGNFNQINFASSYRKNSLPVLLYYMVLTIPSISLVLNPFKSFFKLHAPF